MNPFFLFTLLLFFRIDAFAESAFSACSSHSRVGEICEVNVHSLRPAQFSVGLIQVKDLKKKLAAKSDDEYQDWLRHHSISIVFGPNQKCYTIDGHHRARAVLDLGRGVEIPAEVVANFSTLSTEQFWAKMQKEHYVYLYDQNGDGPYPPTQLPNSIAELKDDPYRSLSAAVRDEGGYKKTKIYFAEFIWAGYFRKLISRSLIENDFDKAVKSAKKFAQSSDAAGLPGYCGNDCNGN